ncbi:hypothetical protein VOLCADRAFT_59975 [Volvox carteri f. nagariensis]|uniref:Histone deacetylase domain-containing protein n=1 Tax=Volvox carteri f. nagariensis TaxID=3068 RepID=D8TUF1_VOLCA|nr:uncharacterized protein VOLCADRAFT_59975 [Volvox carteri f. nagariensis]EFJ48813.1 hypothetical protein VOLCADRAFT_59975 [Volvox carteri f. nagariensis]|eukprot:XP_002950145.1 hypothetical protein VOLCADRAFT_59975 [Volvox carteri f. nagariensis]
MSSTADANYGPAPDGAAGPPKLPTRFSSLARLPPGSLSSAYADLCSGPWPGPCQLPVVYHPSYNISFFGVEKLHPFDSCKYGKVMSALKKQHVLREGQTVQPREASLEVLADVHTQDYLYRIHYHNFTIVQVTELAALSLLPNKLLQWRIVAPMKLHVGGTMLATGLALERGWAINIGGGMHHASSSRGMGWCPFDDIVLAVRRVRKAAGRLVVLYIDLDAHQGNGVERDFYIIDFYNARIFPLDDEAKPAIDIPVELRFGADDDEILGRLHAALAVAARTLPRPDLVIYNAGTDVLAGDPLGRLGMTAAGVVQRDEVVWRWCRDMARAPVVMALSGGYTRESAGVITASIRNLFEKFGLGVDDVAAGSGGSTVEASQAVAPAGPGEDGDKGGAGTPATAGGLEMQGGMWGEKVEVQANAADAGPVSN